jgi:hypothetical protein
LGAFFAPQKTGLCGGSVVTLRATTASRPSNPLRTNRLQNRIAVLLLEFCCAKLKGLSAVYPSAMYPDMEFCNVKNHKTLDVSRKMCYIAYCSKQTAYFIFLGGSYEKDQYMF